MSRILVAIPIVLSLSPQCAWSADFEPYSRIDTVTIHPDGAVVTRIVDFDVPAGRSTLRIPNLPPFDRVSIQVDPVNNNPIFSSYWLNTRILPGETRPILDRDLDTKYKLLMSERDGLQQRIEALQRKKSAVEVHAPSQPERLVHEGPVDPSDWVSAWEMIEQGISKANEGLHPLRTRTVELDAEIAALEVAHPRIGGPPIPRTELTLTVNANEAARGVFRLIYRVVGAYWSPQYDAHLVTDDGAGERSLLLIRRALVVQCTGEPWANIRLSLATSATDQGMTVFHPPVLRARLLQTAQDSHREEENSTRTGKLAAKCMKGPPRSVEPVAATEGNDVTASVTLAADVDHREHVEAARLSETYMIEEKLDIADNGSLTNLTISQETLQPKLIWQAAPEFDSKSYVEASFSVTGGRSLLPGEVTLYQNGRLVGYANMPLLSLFSSHKLGFGVDEKVKVSRIPQYRQETESRILGSSKTERKEIQTTVSNQHSRAIKVRIMDRMPVTENVAIVIEQNSGSTPSEPVSNDGSGTVAWVVDVPPGAEKKILFAYTIKWPVDQNLHLGLPSPGQKSGSRY